MATRQSVEDYLQQGEDTLRYAREQYETGAKQEHFNDTEYMKAQQMLEDTVNDLNKLSLSANDQQKEQLYRMRLQLQQLQNEMILLRH
ncbi:YtzC family protein [Metabacillus arenae]|uniref:YtzC family protein n=1 Tax=Metabacillus arenae TaxID=2771434 RepID=A0A926NET5_9BACI|nr:YtzC family protein [Metabacillus arenae]MBD1380214.1 YtzC family protein [Metabacillus arenae]